LDLAAVGKVPRDLGPGIVEGPPLEELVEPRARFPPQSRVLLAQALGLDAFVLLLLRTDRVGLGQVDVLARARLAGRPRLAVGTGSAIATGLGIGAEFGVGTGLPFVARLAVVARLRIRMRP